MKQNGAYALVLVGLAYQNLATALEVTRINPELDPVSDKKFFKKDYPDDARPQQYHHFDHPYPTVQDSDRYDKDYVKDENDDGGYWKAQMEYDAVKNKLAKEKKDMARALAKENEEQKELDNAKAAEDAAETAAEDAEKKEDEAAADRKTADAEHDDMKKHLDESAEEVETEVKNLEDCKKQLQEAKAKLKTMLAEKETTEKAMERADAAEKGAEEKEKAAEKTAAELFKEYEKAKEGYEAAHIAIEKEKADVEEAESVLKKGAEKLRKYRHADPDGGVYETKSRASYAKPLVALLLMSSCTLL